MRFRVKSINYADEEIIEVYKDAFAKVDYEVTSKKEIVISLDVMDDFLDFVKNLDSQIIYNYEYDEDEINVRYGTIIIYDHYYE